MFTYGSKHQKDIAVKEANFSPPIGEDSKICFVQKDVSMTFGKEEVCEYDIFFLLNYPILISMHQIFRISLLLGNSSLSRLTHSILLSSW